LENPAASPVDVPVAAQLPRFAVVDHEDVDPLEQSEQCGLFALDPVVHGVAHNQLGVLDLLQNAELQLGVDIPQEEKARRAKAGRKPGLKIGEDAKSGLQCFPTLQVVGVLALPAKALAVCPLDPGPIDAARCQTLQLLVGIIGTDDPNHLDRVQDRAGYTEVNRGAAQGVGRLAEGGEDRIQRNASNDEQAHRFTSDPEQRCQAGAAHWRERCARLAPAGVGRAQSIPPRELLPPWCGDTRREPRLQAPGDTQ